MQLQLIRLLFDMSRFLDPQPDRITKKFREFLGGNSSSYLGYLSDRCMI